MEREMLIQRVENLVELEDKIRGAYSTSSMLRAMIKRLSETITEGGSIDPSDPDGLIHGLRAVSLTLVHQMTELRDFDIRIELRNIHGSGEGLFLSRSNSFREERPASTK